MRERRPIAAALAAVVAAAALGASACALVEGSPERLTVAIVDVPATGLVHVARHERYFEDARVDVRFVSFPTGREALAALMDGRADAATVFETPYVARVLQGDRPRILTTLHQSTRNTRVVVPVGRGIRGPEDLRGRRVAVPRGTNAEFFLETLVALAGLDPLEVRQVDALPQDTGPMLARRQVDAAAVWYPYAQCGDPPIGELTCTELFADGYIEFSMIVTRDDVLSQKREGLTRFVRALSRAEHVVLRRPDAAVAALSAELPDGGGRHLADAWRRVTPQLGLDYLLLAVLEREAHWFEQRMDQPTPAVEFRNLVAPEILLEIDPEAVTLLAGR